MTTNATMSDFKREIERTAQKDVNIKIDYEADSSVSFLDVQITNQDGLLRTKIYHKPLAEPHVLPYHSEHPRHFPYAAALRAARICSHIETYGLISTSSLSSFTTESNNETRNHNHASF